MHAYRYRPGQANLQFYLCQTLVIFSKIKIQGLLNDQNADFDLQKLPNLIYRKIRVAQSENLCI